MVARPMTASLALHDGRAGNARQALALAQALDSGAKEWTLEPQSPWRRFAPLLLPGATRAFGSAFTAYLRLPPPLAIGCGRQAALATRLLRQRGSLAVQVLDPRIDARHWDAVVVPEHDALRGSNVITTLGSLHPVDDDFLLRAIAGFPELALLPTPHTVLLVGGPSRHAPLEDAAFAALLAQLSAHAKAEGGSFSAIASRRTPPAWRQAIGALPTELPGLRWCDSSDGANPYAGLLASADRLICTPDSVNMLSEAAATHAPVFVWSADSVHGRPRTFIDTLLERGRIHPLDDTLVPFCAPPLRETVRVAELLRTRLQLL